MAIPVIPIPTLAPQVNPVMAGLGQAANLYSAMAKNQYLAPTLQQNLLKSQLANKLAEANVAVAPQLAHANLLKAQLANQLAQANVAVAPEMAKANLGIAQARIPLMGAQTQLMLGGQLPQAQAQAGLLGSEAAKNQFAISHPGIMYPGIVGQLMAAKYATGNVPSPNAVSANTRQMIPGMPSAGKMPIGNAPLNGPLLPPNPYGSSPSSSQNVSASSPNNSQNSPSLSAQEGTQLQNYLTEAIMAPTQKNIAQADYYQKLANGYNYKNLTTPQKNSVIGQAVALGYTPLQAINAYNNGATISDLAKAKGIDPNHLPPPIYAPEDKIIGMVQQTNRALAEINTIQPEMTAALAPYSRRFEGYSPKQIGEALSNQNPDSQSRYLAARGLIPEMSAMRLKAMGGTQIGIEAMKDVAEKSMANLKALQPFVSPQVYAKSQSYIDQWINQAAVAANKIATAGTLANTGGINPSQQTLNPAISGNSSNVSSSPGLIKVISPDGRSGSIPANNLTEALKSGYRRVG